MAEKINMRTNYPILKEQGQAFKKLFDDFYTTFDNWFTLNPFGGQLADRVAAADWISGKWDKIPANNVSIATGGHHASLIVLLAAKLQGRAIAVEELSYTSFMDIAKMLGIQLISCKSDDHGMLSDSLKEQVAQHDIKAVYLMPTLNNPTGLVMPIARRLEIVEIAKENELIVIDDDAYGFLVADAPPNFAQLYPENGWYIYSLSKPLAPDIKVAYIAAPEKYTLDITKAIQLTSSNPSTFFTAFVTQLIKNGDLQQLVLNKRKQGKERQAIAQDILSEWSINAHENGWHLWLKLTNGLSAEIITAKLLANGVEVTPSTLFCAPGIQINEFIRVALGGEQEMNRVISGLETIKNALLGH